VDFHRKTLLAAVVAIGAVATAHAQPASTAPATRFLTLQELERRALDSNPTVAQADALVRSVLGRRIQADRYPNPIVGYSAEDLTSRDPGRSKHFLWAQQSIITAGKRKHVQAAVEQERVHAESEKEMQRQRVLNGVRVLYYEALGAARLVEIRRALAGIAREAVDVSEELFNVGQADRPDVLEVGIESQRTELELTKAENDQARVWAELATMIGEPDLPITPLAGDLEADVPAVDEAAVRKRLLDDSPELKIARARVEHAKASLARARADRIPNFFVRGGAGYNFDKYESTSRNVGPEFFVEIGVPLPIFDRNTGNIATAEAQLRLAEGEVRRSELSLRQRLAGALRTYRDAVRTAEAYRAGILAQAQQSYELYLTRFREMSAAYPQVLIARRNLGQIRTDYVRSLVDAWQHAVLLEGLLLTDGLEAPKAVPGEPGVTIEIVPFTTTP
jgi:cobalt-zinc-cadmium efflux system outer membrane protein